ncbi:MAG: hypothetical protein ABIQ90_08250 [Polaromonas sp.]
MTSEESHAVPATLLEGRFNGRSEFSELVRRALAAAAAQGWREIILSDPDFEDWPLGETVVAQALNDWSGSGRTLTMLAKNYDVVLRRHARFVTWRKNWSHLVECRSSAAVADSLPSALWSPGWVLERLDFQRSTGAAGFDAERRVSLKQRLNELLLNSSPAFPATFLGL